MSAVQNISRAVQEERTTARRVVERAEELLRAADAQGLNAALDWSPEYLGREAGRIERLVTRDPSRPTGTGPRW